MGTHGHTLAPDPKNSEDDGMIRLEVLNPHENHGMGETDDSFSHSEVEFSGESHNPWTGVHRMSVSGSAITEYRLTLDVIYR